MYNIIALLRLKGQVVFFPYEVSTEAVSFYYYQRADLKVIFFGPKSDNKVMKNGPKSDEKVISNSTFLLNSYILLLKYQWHIMIFDKFFLAGFDNQQTENFNHKIATFQVYQDQICKQGQKTPPLNTKINPPVLENSTTHLIKNK